LTCASIAIRPKEPNPAWRRTVKKERRYGFSHVVSEILPAIRLSNNTFTKAFSYKAAILLLKDLEKELARSILHTTKQSQET
jgi:hypothetical protein